VTDTRKPITGLWTHRGRVEGGSIKVGDEALLEVDISRRERIRRNHSATHLTHWALRKVLGPHAQQKGSLVGPDRLRFDFTHNSAPSREELHEIERLVNEQILQNHPVRTEVLTMQQARERGAMMIFEEKYGDVVRLLTMGPSAELCGGTHARATGDLGLLKIIAEQGVAAGVRRLFATTGAGSLSYVQGVEAQLAQAADVLKVAPEGVVEKVSKLLDRQKSLEREVEAMKRKLLSGGSGGGIDAMLTGAREVGGVRVLGVRVEVGDRAALRELAEQLRDRLGEAVVLVGGIEGDKASLVVTVSQASTTRYKAGELIKVVAGKVGGSGGGRPDMAQAGGAEIAGLDAAVEAIYAAVAAVAG
jgi:alanyl-tRNA synthetase